MDHQCDCSSSSSTTEASSGLKCRVCGSDGDCTSDSDNGISKECEAGDDVCVYGVGSKYY